MTATHNRRWIRFSVRMLLVAVTLVAVVLGAWTQRGRWYAYRLQYGDSPRAAWGQLLRLNGRQTPTNLGSVNFVVWGPDRADSDCPYVWVCCNSELRCVSTSGIILDSQIAVNGSSPVVLWNDLLPDDSPGIAITESSADESYLLCVAAPSGRLVSRLLVTFDDPDVSVDVVDQQNAPAFKLHSPDGSASQTMAFPYGPLNSISPGLPADDAQAPWEIVICQ